MGGTLSQSDLDALFGSIEPAQNPGVEGAGAADVFEGLDISQLCRGPGQDAAPRSSPGSETMSQDEIDALLAEFLG